MTETPTPRDLVESGALPSRPPGGTKTDDGGRPVVDDGGRPVTLDSPSADEIENGDDDRMGAGDDPSRFTVAQVTDYLRDASDAERDRVLAAERAGNGRVGIVGS